MNLLVLKNEINTDPLALGYAGKTDQQTADILNTAPAAPVTGRQTPRQLVDTWQVWECITAPDWATLTADQKLQIQITISATKMDMRAANTTSRLGSFFPAGSDTRRNLSTLAQQPVTRATALGLDFVNYWDVANARVA